MQAILNTIRNIIGRRLLNASYNFKYSNEHEYRSNSLDKWVNKLFAL